MAPPPGPSTGSVPGALAHFASFETQLRLLLDSVPTLALPPLGLPQPGSSNELILFRLFVLELLAYSMDVRRAIIFGKRKGHPKTTHIALAVFRYPEDIEQATYDLAQLAGRMTTRFNDWCLTWSIRDGADLSGLEPIEHLKQLASKNLVYTSEFEFLWLEALIRICGDLPELWNHKVLSTYVAQREADFPYCGDSGGLAQVTAYDNHGSSRSSSHQSSFDVPPATAYDNHDLSCPSSHQSSFEVPPATAYDSHGSFHPSLHPSRSKFGLAMYESTFHSSYSLPHPSLSNPAFAMYYGDGGASRSLPDLPSGTDSQTQGASGVGSDWSGHNVVSMGHHKHVSGPSSIQHQNLQHVPHSFIPMTVAQSIPSNASHSDRIPSAASSTPFNGGPVSSNSSLPSAAAPVAMPTAVTRPNVPQAFGDSSDGSHSTAEVADAVELEHAKTATLAARNSLMRARGSRLGEYSHLMLTAMGVHYDSMHRVLCGEYLEVPLLSQHREALLETPHSIGQLMVCVYIDWKRDMDV